MHTKEHTHHNTLHNRAIHTHHTLRIDFRSEHQTVGRAAVALSGQRIRVALHR
jgi:hypothetical protein